jgi:hydrogenase maturation factor
MVEDIFAQTSQACLSLGITLCGGHTEITHGLDRPIAVGLMLGEVEKQDLVQTDGARVGDDVLLTKGIALEGTSVLARERGSQLEAHLPSETVARARGFLMEPGISVLRDAQIVQQAGRPHAMHDPTEGGLSTGLWELAQASDRAITVDLGQVHQFPETQAICRLLGLDPLGLLASGALLVVASPEDSVRMVSALEGEGIDAAIIGRVSDGPPAVHLKTASGLRPFPSFARDELARVFEQPA